MLYRMTKAPISRVVNSTALVATYLSAGYTFDGLCDANGVLTLAEDLDVRKDLAANWALLNPVLALGEPGLATDTRILKMGDGTTAWNSLAGILVGEDADQKFTTDHGADFADEMGAVVGVAVKAQATIVSDTNPVNVAASGKVTIGGTNAADGSTVEIASKVYTFKTALTTDPAVVEGEVKIGATPAETLDNLKNAVNGDAGSLGTTHQCTAHTLVTATTNTDTAQTFVAILRGTVGNAYNLVASTEPASDLTVAGATFGTGAGCTLGVNHTAIVGAKTYTFVGDTPNAEGEVLAGATAAEALDNFKLAVNGDEATHGVKHFCTANATIEATTNTNTTQLLVARVAGALANTYPVSGTAPVLTVLGGRAYLAGGFNASAAQIINAVAGVILEKAEVYAVAQNASVVGLTAGLLYKFMVLTYGATYGSALSGTGTGTNIMALTASANLHLLIVPIL